MSNFIFQVFTNVLFLVSSYQIARCSEGMDIMDILDPAAINPELI
jgi:hypothetical protein